MTKISREAAAAFVAGRNWRSGNTAVYGSSDRADLHLHGNKIARRGSDGVWITTAGWNTITTTSRLNALPGVKVRIRDGKPVLNGQPWDGDWIRVDVPKTGHEGDATAQDDELIDGITKEAYLEHTRRQTMGLR